MSEANERPDEKPPDIVEGFDLPGGEPAPPPETPQPEKPSGEFDLPQAEPTPAPPPEDVREIEQTLSGSDTFQPHVKEAEKPPAVMGKLIALIGIPLVALVAIFGLRTLKRQPFLEYKQECVATAQRFLKGLSDDTAESVPVAYDMLHKDLREEQAAETVMEQYTRATEGKGEFKQLGSVRWDETEAGQASRSFRSLAQFEEGEQVSVWFKFARVTTDGKTEVRISAYKFGAE